jgi:amino acid transporter
MRPLFKVFLWTVFVLVLLVVVAFIAAAVPAVLAKTALPYGKPCEKQAVMIDKGAAVGLGLASAYLGLSGALGWFFHLMTGYILIFHMVAGGLFAFCLVVLIALRGGRRIANAKRNLLWAVVLALGVLVIFTAVAPMMTWFGTDWQHTMLAAHRCVTFSFLAVAAWMCLTGGRKE